MGWRTQRTSPIAPPSGPSRTGSAEAGASALLMASRRNCFEGFHRRGGQIIDATLVRPEAAHQPGEKALIDQGAMPGRLKPANGARRTSTRPGRRSTARATLAKLDQRRQEIQVHPPDRDRHGRTHDSQHLTTRSWTRPTRAGTPMPTGGYPSAEREAWIEGERLPNQIQRGHRKGRRPSASSGATNPRRRARVEHVCRH